MTREEHIDLHCKNCGFCVVCNDDVQAASSNRYNSEVITTLLEYAPDRFALVQFNKVLYVGDWKGILSAYRNREPYVNKPHAPRAETRKSAGKISAAEKAANTAALLERLRNKA